VDLLDGRFFPVLQSLTKLDTLKIGKMKRKILIVLIILAVVSGVIFFFYLGRERKNPSRLGLKNIADTPVNKICLKISEPGDIYYCLAVTNQDAKYCQNLDMPNQKKLCQGMAKRDVSFCREINEAEPRKMCFYELAAITENINYCDEAEDAEHCYFNLISSFYWAGQAEKIKAEYCNKFPAQSPDRSTCLALKEKDVSLCEENNSACLTLFRQDLSFCENIKPEDKIKCIRDRAIIAEDPAVCERAADQEVKDECYFGYVSHFDPDISLCEKIQAKMKKNACYLGAAIALSKED